MIIMFIGGMGSGKTLTMTAEAIKYTLKGFKIYSNYKLECIPYIPLTKKVFDELIKDKTSLQEAVLLIDEIHIWLDSRSSMKKKNKAISYFLLQTRKRNVRLLCTTQHPDQVDKRLRNNIDILVFCRNVTNKVSTLVNEKKRTVIEAQYCWMHDRHSAPKKILIEANKFYKYYNTTEIIDMDED